MSAGVLARPAREPSGPARGRWTVKRIAVDCGAVAGCQIDAGDPVRVVWRRPDGLQERYRCAAHAHTPVDWSQVELERARLEFDMQREAAARLRREQERPRRPVRIDVRPPRKPKPAREVLQPSLYDPRARAAHDVDD